MNYFVYKILKVDFKFRDLFKMDKERTKSDMAKVIDSDIGQFGIKRSEDTEGVNIRGILVLSHKIVVSDISNEKMKLFDIRQIYIIFRFKDQV